MNKRRRKSIYSHFLLNCSPLSSSVVEALMFRCRQLSLILVLAIASPLLVAAQQLSDSEIEQRVNTLLQKMTLEEKAGQLTQMPGNSAPTLEMVKQGKAGSLLGVLGAKNNNDAQRVAVEQS